MKFRDPKTGEVFEDIDRAYSKFCCGRDCDTDCTLNVFKECGNWATDHPVEAARLMELEVVEDQEDPAAGEAQGGAAKEDAGKPRPTLCPVSLINAVTAVREYGTEVP